jgi:chromosome partitioning protein
MENRLRNTTSGDLMLKRILVTIQADYDLILIDCPPAFNYLTINALSSSNLVLVPAKPEMFSIQGIEMIKDYADKKQIPFKIIFNQVDMRSSYHQLIINSTQVSYQSNLVANYIRNSVSLAEAFEQALDIFKYKENSNGAKDFIKLADELIPYV